MVLDQSLTGISAVIRSPLTPDDWVAWAEGHKRHAFRFAARSYRGRYFDDSLFDEAWNDLLFFIWRNPHGLLSSSRPLGLLLFMYRRQIFKTHSSSFYGPVRHRWARSSEFDLDSVVVGDVDGSVDFYDSLVVKLRPYLKPCDREFLDSLPDLIDAESGKRDYPQSTGGWRWENVWDVVRRVYGDDGLRALDRLKHAAVRVGLRELRAPRVPSGVWGGSARSDAA